MAADQLGPDLTMEDLVARQQQIKAARIPALWDALGVYGSASLWEGVRQAETLEGMRKCLRARARQGCGRGYADV